MPNVRPVIYHIHAGFYVKLSNLAFPFELRLGFRDYKAMALKPVSTVNRREGGEVGVVGGGHTPGSLGAGWRGSWVGKRG